jgi:hypothetical protein
MENKLLLLLLLLLLLPRYSNYIIRTHTGTTVPMRSNIRNLMFYFVKRKVSADMKPENVTEFYWIWDSLICDSDLPSYEQFYTNNPKKITGTVPTGIKYRFPISYRSFLCGVQLICVIYAIFLFVVPKCLCSSSHGIRWKALLGQAYLIKGEKQIRVRLL